MVRLLKVLWKLFILTSVFGIGYIIGREHSFEEDENWDEEESSDTAPSPEPPKSPESIDATNNSATGSAAVEAPRHGELSRISFEYSNEKATSVSVVGDFNDWNKEATPMTNEQGIWRVQIPLKKGRHEYKLVINHTDWVVDPKCPETVADKYGGTSSMRTV